MGEVEFKYASKTKNSTICKDTDIGKIPKNQRKLQWLAVLLSTIQSRKVRWCKQCFIQIPLERDWLVELKLEDMGRKGRSSSCHHRNPSPWGTKAAEWWSGVFFDPCLVVTFILLVPAWTWAYLWTFSDRFSFTEWGQECCLHHKVIARYKWSAWNC